MAYLKNIAVFIFFNAVGFLSAPLCYVIGIHSGTLDPTDPAFSPAVLHVLFNGIIITWMICMIFSLASFFLKGFARMIFLLAPVVLPMAYGLRVLLML